MFYSKLTGGFYSTQIHGTNIPSDAREITMEEYCELMDAQSKGASICAGDDGLPYAKVPDAPTLQDIVTQLTSSVDSEISKIYSRFTRFDVEYQQREAVARAFIAANYAGDPGIWITAFSSASEKTARQAADLIVAQADALRTALTQLGALRMQKYLIASASSAADAQERYADIVSGANAIAAQIQ